MTKDKRMAIFGLGSMGLGVGNSLLRAGILAHGFDVRSDVQASFIASGGAVGTPAQIASDLSTVITVVLNAAQTEDVLFGKPGIVPLLPSGAVVISCATVAPEFARAMESRCNDHGVFYLDAPISGGSVKASAGQLSIMAAGSQSAFDAAKPALDAISETVFDLGRQAGSGSAMKAVNQLLAGVHIAAMSEAITFGMTQGVAPEAFLNVIKNCAGTSWMLENRAPRIVEGDYTPHSQVNIWPKDLGIVLDIARSAGFSAPLTATAFQQYMVAVGMGLGQEDDAALAKVYARNSGLHLPGDKR